MAGILTIMTNSDWRHETHTRKYFVLFPFCGKLQTDICLNEWAVKWNSQVNMDFYESFSVAVLISGERNQKVTSLLPLALPGKEIRADLRLWEIIY